MYSNKILDNNIPIIQNNFYFRRPRIMTLLKEAIDFPVITICAGAGYGKTRAVYDFIQIENCVTMWMQCSEKDNNSSRFWESFLQSIQQTNKELAEKLAEIGFPNTEDKFNQYIVAKKDLSGEKRLIIVIDDFHLIHNTEVLHFFEAANNTRLPNKTLILISRSLPKINLLKLTVQNLVFSINEEELSFKENEIVEYFSRIGIPLKNEAIADIFKDTDGWAFAINLIARSLKKLPNYQSYVKQAMKLNIFSLMESEIFSQISEELQHFLIKLSLIEHLSADLVKNLAPDDNILKEFEQQNAYIRYDVRINVYLIHHLFLDFLHEKQDTLTKKEKYETYKLAGDWCFENDLKMDAIFYYEKIGDYEKITNIVYNFSMQVSPEFARFALEIFKNAPKDSATKILRFAVVHVRLVMNLCRLDECWALTEEYIAMFEEMSEGYFKIISLYSMYYAFMMIRRLQSTYDGVYDFDIYAALQNECFSKAPFEYKGPTRGIDDWNLVYNGR